MEFHSKYNEEQDFLMPRTRIFCDHGTQKSQKHNFAFKRRGNTEPEVSAPTENVNKQICLYPPARTEVKLGNSQYPIQTDGTLVFTSLQAHKHLGDA